MSTVRHDDGETERPPPPNTVSEYVRLKQQARSLQKQIRKENKIKARRKKVEDLTNTLDSLRNENKDIGLLR